MNKSIFILLALLIEVNIYSQETNWKKEIHPFTTIGNNSIQSITGINAIIQLSSLVSTYGIISSNFDYKLHNYFSAHKDFYHKSSIPAVYLGYLVPISLGGGLYAGGLWHNNPRLAAAGCAVLQASLLAWTETSLLKVFTGRKNPDNFVYTKSNDASKKFQLGILRNGIHYGWPSGHMAVSTALLTSLVSLYNENTFMQATAWIAWLYMLYGVMVHEGNTMHWFSDIISGSLIGYTIGTSVGKNFRNALQNKTETSKIQYNTFINSGSIGLKISFQF